MENETYKPRDTANQASAATSRQGNCNQRARSTIVAPTQTRARLIDHL